MSSDVPATAVAVVSDGLVPWVTGDREKTCRLSLTPLLKNFA